MTKTYTIDNPVYKLIINNLRSHVSKMSPQDRIEDEGDTVFEAARILSIGLCISQEEILQDLVL